MSSGLFGSLVAGPDRLHRFEVLAAGIVLYGNTDDDFDPEFAIYLAGVDTLENSDLIL